METDWELIDEFVTTLEAELAELNGITMQKDFQVNQERMATAQSGRRERQMETD